MVKTITRKGSTPIKVFCLPEEKSRIEENAAGTGQSTSTYLRNVGMGMPVRSTLDHDLILKLAKINGDQGRLGGLLKLWLTDDQKLRVIEDPRRMSELILQLLERITRAQDAMYGLVQMAERNFSR